MGTASLKVKSVTYAIKLKKLLARSGIYANVVKFGISNDGDGCSYGISFKNEYLLDVIRISRSAGIEYSLVDTP